MQQQPLQMRINRTEQALDTLNEFLPDSDQIGTLQEMIGALMVGQRTILQNQLRELYGERDQAPQEEIQQATA